MTVPRPAIAPAPPGPRALTKPFHHDQLIDAIAEVM